jgi:hypothetical protein
VPAEHVDAADTSAVFLSSGALQEALSHVESPGVPTTTSPLHDKRRARRFSLTLRSGVGEFESRNQVILSTSNVVSHRIERRGPMARVRGYFEAGDSERRIDLTDELVAPIVLLTKSAAGKRTIP